ncbi:hypothetical protein GCM10025868_05780 [Angustibacter aerolatus]|uniref:Virulence factor MviN n=1 Tax=Angustibacter aerolatus TaxID=1162965 RepID=A0ABQ6JAX7_9ACTN|nr:lipid II flippase MurJ [Angustibacter aerolatus]GMA85328.1 hypothetical protein GCM10025868_05780 [Angustibacter aerolatus]
MQAATVGNQCVGSAYAAANAVPNVLYEVVAGGALAGAVVPLLAGAIGRGDREQVSRTASALLGWALAVLVPVAVLLAALSGPLSRALVPAGCEAARGATSLLLLTFAPQVLLYGVSVVLTGVLQAHHRFTWPALAPLLSSAVVVAVYVLYAVVSGSTARHPDGWLPGDGALLLLGLGTTLGVVALSLPLLVPASRAGVRLRPTLRFDDGVGRRALGLAGAGLAGLVAQQAGGGPDAVADPAVGRHRRVQRLPVRAGRVPAAVRRARGAAGHGGVPAAGRPARRRRRRRLPLGAHPVDAGGAGRRLHRCGRAGGGGPGGRHVLLGDLRGRCRPGAVGAAGGPDGVRARPARLRADRAPGAGAVRRRRSPLGGPFHRGRLAARRRAVGRAGARAGRHRVGQPGHPARARPGQQRRHDAGRRTAAARCRAHDGRRAAGAAARGAARRTGRGAERPGGGGGRPVRRRRGRGPGVGRSLLAAVLAAACCLLVLGAGLLVADRPDVDAVLRRGRMVP